MSSIASGVSGVEALAVRAVARPAPVERVAPVAVRAEGPALRTEPRSPAPDSPRDSRFDAPAEAHRVRQIVQQLTAAVAYGANVSVVSNGTTIHATIDISG